MAINDATPISLRYRKPGRVYSVDAIQWDFEFKPAKLGAHHKAHIHPSDKMDVYLTKEGVDYRHLNNTSLFNIGGFFHYHDTDGEGIFIEEGIRTMQRMQTPHINIINFEEVKGKVNLYRINSHDIMRADLGTELYEKAMFQIPGLDVKNDLVGIVFCGELYWIDPIKDDKGKKVRQNELVKLISCDTFVINLHKWHLTQKIYTYKNYFGKKKMMGLTPYLDNRISADEVRSDDFIKYLFGLSQTFVVTVKTPSELFIRKKMVARDHCIKRYFMPAFKDKKRGFAYEPLVTSDGRYLPYIARDDRNMVCLSTEDNFIYPQQNDALSRDDVPYLVELNRSARKGEAMTAHFLCMTLEKENDEIFAQDLVVTTEASLDEENLTLSEVESEEQSSTSSDEIIWRRTWRNENVVVDMPVVEKYQPK